MAAFLPGRSGFAAESSDMSHRRAVALMVLVTLLWSIAGVVSRHLDAAASFEVTFWRSLFNALALSIALTLMRGSGLWRSLLRAPWPVWFSGVCWSVMFTAFMLAITLTTVANVLVTMAVGPLMTALFTRVFLHHRLPARTWLAIAVAGVGIAYKLVQALAPSFSVPVPRFGASDSTNVSHLLYAARRPSRRTLTTAILAGVESLGQYGRQLTIDIHSDDEP